MLNIPNRPSIGVGGGGKTADRIQGRATFLPFLQYRHQNVPCYHVKKIIHRQPDRPLIFFYLKKARKAMQVKNKVNPK
jgi:hypothetical protein